MKLGKQVIVMFFMLVTALVMEKDVANQGLSFSELPNVFAGANQIEENKRVAMQSVVLGWMLFFILYSFLPVQLFPRGGKMGLFRFPPAVEMALFGLLGMGFFAYLVYL